MPSLFPGSLDSFATKTDGVDDVLAAHVNNLQDAMVAVETNIGASAKGTVADLSARLNVSMNADGTLKSAAIPAAAVDSVNTEAIQDGAVTADEIAAGTIVTANLADGAVTSAKILDGTITGADIAGNTIDGSKLTDNAITTSKITDANVTPAKLSAGLRATHEQFRAVQAKGTATVFPLTATDTALHTSSITNPDVPRALSYTLKNTSGGTLTPNAAHVAVVGFDSRGVAISENIANPASSVLAGASLTVTGLKPFATITSVQLSDGQTVDWQFSIGTTDLVGLCKTLASVFKLTKNHADVLPVPAVDTTNGTIDLSTVSSGDDFGVWYLSA